jgi:hypothetical protein
MYLQSIDDAGKKLAELLEAAEYLQIAGLKEICLNMLIETIKVETCLELMNTAYKYNMDLLKKLTADILYPNRQSFCSCNSLMLVHSRPR